MINDLNNWVQGIVIAIIVSSIIQMLLPENKNKKYIKSVIGVYILFSILSPVVGKNLKISEYDLEKYMDVKSNERINENIIYDDNVKIAFKSKVKENIKQQLKNKGYVANNIEVELDENCNIKKIILSDIYENTKEEQTQNEINVNKVEKVNIKDRPEKGMAISDENSLIKYLSENYQISEENIVIE